jgi:hypothetical protein
VRVSSKLAELVLPDWQGDFVELSDLWRDQTMVIAFVRHFG